MHSEKVLGQAGRRGVFEVGDRVQLTDPKGRKSTITLIEKGSFNSHRGSFRHSELLGKPEGTVISTGEGIKYLAFRPLLSDYVLSMPRGAAIVYPKDAGQIIQMADIFPGAFVVEAGVGSGALTLSLLSAIGQEGSLLSIERREDFAEIAQANVDLWFGQRHPGWQLAIGDFSDVLPQVALPNTVDRIVLDMLSPWENLDAVADALVPGGVLLCYVATVSQLSRLAEDLRADGRFTEPHGWEAMLRDWHLEGLAVRPEHRMIAHTGFILTVRRLAEGVTAPFLRRRPAAAAEGLAGAWDNETGWSAADGGQRPISERKLKRIRKDLTARVSTWIDPPD